jgi:tripartite-type tricarboxylate transporter receptor subunit TctC
MKKRALLVLAVAASALLGFHGPASAQPYPNKSVRMIIPFPPGGTLDFVGRQLAQKLSDQTGQQFVVENRPGGNNMIGSASVAAAAPDGYTLLFNASTFTTTPMTVKSSQYDVLKEFTPIALVAKAPLSVSVGPQVPATDVKSLAAHAKASPTKLTFAVGSTGSAGNLATELLRRAGGFDLLIVPYKGSGPAYQDLLGGRIDVFVDPVLGAVGHHKGGKLKIVAVTSKARIPSLPDVPTVGETIPGYEFYSWYGLWGPAKLPADISAKLNAETNKALAELREKLEAQGLLVTPGTIDDFVRFQAADMELSKKIITDANIRAE